MSGMSVNAKKKAAPPESPRAGKGKQKSFIDPVGNEVDLHALDDLAKTVDEGEFDKKEDAALNIPWVFFPIVRQKFKVAHKRTQDTKCWVCDEHGVSVLQDGYGFVHCKSHRCETVYKVGLVWNLLIRNELPVTCFEAKGLSGIAKSDNEGRQLVSLCKEGGQIAFVYSHHTDEEVADKRIPVDADALSRLKSFPIQFPRMFPEGAIRNWMSLLS
jgi:hypothetical protein